MITLNTEKIEENVRRMSPEKEVSLGEVGSEAEVIEIVIDPGNIEEDPIQDLTAETGRDIEEAEIAKDLDPLEMRDTVTETEREEALETDIKKEIGKRSPEANLRKKT